MNTLILAITLISGYTYVINAVSARYKFKRSDGWDAYFYIAVWGVLFVVIAWLFCSLLSVFDVFRSIYNYLLSKGIIDVETINKAFPLSHIDKTAGANQAITLSHNPYYYTRLDDLKFALFGVISISLSWLAGNFVKCIVNRSIQSRAEALVKIVHNDPFESMLIEADVRRFPVIITLSSRKVYIGFVFCPQFEHGRIEYIEILPLLSGYRDKNDLTVKITTNYRKHYEDSGILNGLGESHLLLDDFITPIPKKDIEGISFFDTSAYLKFKEDEEKDKADYSSL